MTESLSPEEYEERRRRLLDDMSATRDVINRATARACEIERDLHLLYNAYSQQKANDPA